MKIFFILVLAVINSNIGYAKYNASNHILELSGEWQFCPSETYQPNIDINQLKCYNIDVPTPWEKILPDYDGYGLLYTTFKIPKSLKNTHLALSVKRIRDADKTFINQVLIGETGGFPPYFEKAVFYSRLYSIPQNSLDYEGDNTLSMWVYNNARPGGIISFTPTITSYESSIFERHLKNLFVFGLIVVLMVFSLTSLINYALNIKSLENFYFGLFLLAWSFYLFTSSDLVLLTNFSLDFMFRVNIITFFAIFALFLLYIYKFFKIPIPFILKASIAISIIFIPISFILPDPKQLYILVNIVEFLALPSLYFGTVLLIIANKEKRPYAKVMTVVLSLYISFGFAEILLDYFSANEAATYSPLGPWVLMVLSVVLTIIVGHKNMSYYQKATFDGLTGTLRFENFPSRLDKLIQQAPNENKLILMMMLDLDDFKNINDHYGHLQGDNVLATVGRTLRNEVTQNDILARYGGDEFCIATTADSEQLLRLFVENIHEKINRIRVYSNDEIINISNTIGAYIHYSELTTITSKQLIKKADDLLIMAKTNDKGNVLW